MKIADNSTTNTPFATLEVGSVFKFANLIFMKTSDVIDKDLGIPSNAIMLDNGSSAMFASDTIVTVVDCELVIK